MRYLIISDIHGNLDALETVLRHAAPAGFDEVLVLGDLVGYGADPGAVVTRVQDLQPLAVIRGNHDKVAAGIDDASGFNAVAKSAVHWTLDALSPEQRDYLKALPMGPLVVDDLVEICHGTPHDEDAYVFDELDALQALSSASRPVCLYGHTHIPVVFSCQPGGPLEVETAEGAAEYRVGLESGRRYLINPGSVGQPRDGDPRAAYALVDTGAGTVDLFRVEYPVAEAQQKIVAAGLPDVLARRLGVGR